MPYQPASDALKNIVVIDLTRVRSGPTCVRQLADWGANVIKVEAPGSLEKDGALGAGRNTGDFQNLQRNKRSISLNLKNVEGIKILLKLVKTADIVVENFRPDVKDRLGINYKSLNEINPRIILASISGFGQDGPYSKRPGFDQIAQGMGGLMSITGNPGKGPMRVGIPIADLTAGLFCALGIFVALFERVQSGKGQWVQSSLLQSQAFMLDFQAARYLMEGEIAKQAGNDHPTSIPTGVFPTSDGSINLAIAGDTIWLRFCESMKESWAQDPRFSTNTNRSINRVALNALIAARTQDQASSFWIDTLSEAGVPCGRINNIKEMFDDPQVQHLGIAQDIETNAFGATQMLGQPVTLSRTPSSLAQRPPERGEHTSEVLLDLGYNEKEISNLINQNII
jgi:crotonobetainyl-CoA:carnitine CoA-transferase CaiB-like acyl-CoA transferase